MGDDHSYQFPKDFLWGTATSGHQTEGNNTNSDWWQWENRTRQGGSAALYPVEPSRVACNSYNRYEEDLDLCVELNNNAVRLGVEWARLEPKPGIFDQKEFEHYKKVLQAAKNRKLKTLVTLNHFTLPLWFSEAGGWTRISSPKYFSSFAKKCALEFGNLADIYLTLNEPQVYTLQSYFLGKWPPQKKNPLLSLIVQINLMRAHNSAFETIKSAGNYPVGIVKNIAYYMPKNVNPLSILTAKILNFIGADFFLFPVKKHLDVLGINYYFTKNVDGLKLTEPDTYKSDLGWALETQGLAAILDNLKKYKLPVYITENGLADSTDRYRTRYLNKILDVCAQAIRNGTNLKGYFHWSLIDNYEWALGFRPRFGLVEIDYQNNLERKPRPSFYAYAKICKNGTIKR